MMVARDILLDRFRWVDGHTGVWRIFRDPLALRTRLGLNTLEAFGTLSGLYVNLAICVVGALSVVCASFPATLAYGLSGIV